MKTLKEIVDHFQERIEGNRYVQLLDGSKVERWKHYGVQRRIAQAACNYGGYVVTGTRHYCPLMCLQIDSVGSNQLIEFAGGLDKVIQGFTDQYGVFLTREEAYVIAKEAGQIIREDYQPGVLYSECYI
jgi:hypothetical protein